jgi:hypothetical protein
VDGWASSLPSAVRVTVTKVRTGDSTEELVAAEDAVGDDMETANVGGMEKEFIEEPMIVGIVVLSVDEEIDDGVGTAVEPESLKTMNETAAASTVGFGWFFPGMGFPTVITEVTNDTAELSGVAIGVTAGAVTSKAVSTEMEMKSQCMSRGRIHERLTLVHSRHCYQRRVALIDARQRFILHLCARVRQKCWRCS